MQHHRSLNYEFRSLAYVKIEVSIWPLDSRVPAWLYAHMCMMCMTGDEKYRRNLPGRLYVSQTAKMKISMHALNKVHCRPHRDRSNGITELNGILMKARPERRSGYIHISVAALL